MQTYELDTWLGDTEVTDGQRSALLAAAAAVDARYPDADLTDDRRRAFTAAAMIILGDVTLEEIAERWHVAYRVQQDKHAALTGALIASSGSEVELAKRAGTTRMTVRKALGK